ncbi:MAG: UDP-N-acetylmuramoyl-L-alanine--D-glutamate ligase [Gammaproteobacteria bacterium]|nr:UDP-N-acetylmuramoyl-L-alanine--D-glutamate ligase [Gammaproteobacteria bacterium]NNJ50636.1 UDP-N-acetylmuramoyl-L-alanine--D-glutamate ligase [Gammaproteobacteria bacterium]
MSAKPEQAVYTLVVGLGKTGLSVVRYLYALGEPVVVVDSRDIPPGLNELKSQYDDVELYTGSFDVSLFLKARRIVVSPGVALAEPALVEARKNNIEIIGDIDLFAHEVKAPVVGITGSNGKSTVTTLLASMATRAGLNSVASGNIGTPVLDSLDDDIGLYVLELSSFQLETLHKLPMKAAVVLNISADHLDRYENLAAYAMCKQVIYENADVLVINKDDALAGGQLAGKPGVQLRFTLDAPENNEFGLCGDQASKLCFGEQQLIAVDDLVIKGKHNIQNALAALALGYAIGLPMDIMLNTLRDFKGLKHRAQLVAETNGISWINDSKATNVGAAIAALTGLPGKHVLIAGGIAKGADFSELTDVVSKHCRAVVLLGKDADRIESVIPGGMEVKRVPDMQSAVNTAATLAQPGDNVLLAPACASFDMFDNFEQRGDAFIQAVEALQS